MVDAETFQATSFNVEVVPKDLTESDFAKESPFLTEKLPPVAFDQSQVVDSWKR